MRVLSRRLARLRAWCGGYFWLPCPNCGRYFGGHEMTAAHVLETSRYGGKATCPDRSCVSDVLSKNFRRWCDEITALCAPQPKEASMSYPVTGRSVVQDWVADMPLRHQGVLLAAVRGCDGAMKENSAKPITRAVRHAFLNAADPREVGLPSAFMAPGFTQQELRGFLTNWDHFPMHFIQHLMHACQVLGFKHPDPATAELFLTAYRRIVFKLHLSPESEADMDTRLTEDRIALYGNAVGAEAA